MIIISGSHPNSPIWIYAPFYIIVGQLYTGTTISKDFDFIYKIYLAKLFQDYYNSSLAASCYQGNFSCKFALNLQQIAELTPMNNDLPAHMYFWDQRDGKQWVFSELYNLSDLQAKAIVPIQFFSLIE